MEKYILNGQLEEYLVKIHKKYKPFQEGNPASYIPELAKVDPDQFAIAVTTVGGQTFSAGDALNEFTMQSTSKPLMYGYALREHGSDYVHSKVGVEPTGEAFNSIIELEEKSHRPFNPMINSGAIATTSLTKGVDFQDKLRQIKEHFESYVGRSLKIDDKVYLSEKKTAHRNRAIAYLMKHFDVMESDIEETLDLYFKQCSILMNSLDLSRVAATYANRGVQPVNKNQVIASADVSKILSLIFTCGMYDSAGEWAFRVGLPAKSGVSGAIFAVVPGVCGISCYSPRIDSKGHSLRGSLAIQEISEKFKFNIFQMGVVH